MRIAAILFVCVLMCAPAQAQAPAADAAIEAARAIALTMTDDSITQTVIEADMPAHMANLRQSITSSDFYADLRPDTKRALDAYIETLPAFAREQVVATMLSTRSEFARRLVDRYSESELTRLAAVMTDPTFHTLLIRSARAMAVGETFTQDQMTEPERAAFDQFEASTDISTLPNTWDVTQTLSEARLAAQAAMQPALQRRFLTDLCAALSDECPDRIRAHLASQPDN